MSIFLSDIETTFKIEHPRIWSDKDIIEPVINNMPKEIVSKLSEQKKSLNETKHQLDKFNQPPYDFNTVFSNFDFYGDLRSFFQYRKGAQIVTNAWLKAYEMIETYQLIGSRRSINVFYNAELPGAFISATNHYCKTHQVDFQWLASSYLPSDTDSTIVGDKYNIYANYRQNWLMNKHMNGDLTIPENILEIKNNVRRKFFRGVDLYFSDAGMDVDGDFDNQEEINALLNFGQVLSGLTVLAPGGHLVVKQYTFFSALNISLITLLSNMFREFYIVKPLTSRPNNSEVYLVGRNFIGLLPSLEIKLLDIMRSLKKIGPVDCANYSFYENSTRTNSIIDNLVSVSNKIFIKGQKPLLEASIEMIETNLDISDMYEKLGPIHIEKQDKYISRFNIRKLYPDELLNTRRPVIKEEKKGDSIVSSQIAGKTQFGRVFDPNATARLYYTFLTIFNKPFHYKKPEEIAISKKIFKQLEADLKSGLDDETIYNNLYVSMNRLFYDIFGPPNILTEGRANSRVDDIKSIFENIEVMPIIKNYIDFGCGEASITSAVAREVGATNVQGMDIKEPKGPIDFKFVKLNPDETRIPSEDNSTDLLSSFMVLHHLNDPEGYIKEFNRVLIKDGILLIREHDIQGDSDRDGKLFLDMLHGFYEVVWAKTGEQENPDFVKTYFANYKDRQNWTTMIERNGFRRLNHAELELYYNHADLVRDYSAGRKIKNPFYHYYAVYVKE